MELEDRDEKQNEAPKTQEKTVSDLLDYLDMPKSMRPDGINSRV